MKQLTLLSFAWDGWQAKRAGWPGIRVHRDHINYLDANARSQRNAWTDHEPTHVRKYGLNTGLPGDFWRSEQMEFRCALDHSRNDGSARHILDGYAAQFQNLQQKLVLAAGWRWKT